MTDRLRQAAEAALQALDYIIRDLEMRAEDGVVAIGNGAYQGGTRAAEQLRAALDDAMQARRKWYAAGKVAGLQSARTIAEVYCLAKEPRQESIRHILLVVDEIGAAIDLVKGALDKADGGRA